MSFFVMSFFVMNLPYLLHLCTGLLLKDYYLHRYHLDNFFTHYPVDNSKMISKIPLSLKEH